MAAGLSLLPVSGCLSRNPETDWPCYGYDIYNSSYTRDAGPVEDVSLRWRYETEDEVRSSPSVVDGTAYVGSTDGRMYAVDAVTGNLEWSFKVHGEDSVDKPWLDYMERSVDSSPCVTDEAVLFGAWNGFLYSLDRTTGDENWRFGTPEIIRSSPVVNGGKVYIGDWTGDMCAVSTETGDEIWRYGTGGRRVIQSTPCVADGTLCFGVGEMEEEGRGYTPVGGSLRAIDADTGSEFWSFDPEDFVASSPVYSDGNVYFSAGSGTVYCLSIEDGSAVWSFEAEESIPGSPAVDDEAFYICDQGGNLYALNKYNGEARWVYETDSTPYESQVTVTDSSVYFGDDDGLHSVSKTGEHRWTVETGGLVRSRPAVVGKAIYFGSLDGNVYAVEGESG